MPKEFDIETRQNIFQIYLASYKKFKYWFAVFYFLSIVFSLLIYNEEISDKIEKYKTMRNLSEGKKHLNFFNGLNRALTPENIISNLKIKFEYKTISDADWSRGKLQEKARQYKVLRSHADSLNKYTDFIFKTYIDSFKLVLQNDSIMIEDTISYYHIVINQDSLHGNTKKQRLIYRDGIRAKFIKSVNQSQPQEVSEILPLEKVSLNVLKRYPLPDNTYQEKKLNEILIQADTLVSEVENWIKKDIINPQNFRVPLSFGTIKEYSLLIMVVIALFLQFHFINFKFYESQFIDSNQKLIKVPSINNIIENLKIPLLSYRFFLSITSILSYFVNLFIPVIVICLIGKQVWKILDSYIWFYMAILIYIIGSGSLLLYIWQDQKVYVKLRKKLSSLKPDDLAAWVKSKIGNK
jgi:hypothetical protein